MPFLERSPYATVRIEIAYDSGFLTAEDDRTWTAVTTDVDAAVGATITYGRSDELEQPPPNTLALTINNDDGDYTPGTAAPASIKKGLPIRFTVIYGGVDFIRFMGYIDSCSVVWPDGGEKMSQLSVTAASRRARLGQTAPLTSAIRAAYLGSSPDAYWPLSDDRVNTQGRNVFRDITNTPVSGKATTQSLAGFSTSTATAPRINDGVFGPTDEGGMVKFPSTATGVSTSYDRYVGGGGVMRINTQPTGEFSAEIVTRIVPKPTGADPVDIVIFRVGSPALRQEMYCFIYDDTVTGGRKNVGLYMVLRDDNFSIVEQPGWFFAVADQNAEDALYDKVTDGELHHWYVLYQGDVGGVLYVDGEYAAYTLFSGANEFTQVFDSVVIGDITRNGNLWTSALAVYDRWFTLEELAAHVQAALAAEESPEERVVRIAGRLGVPADEVDVEDTIAGDLGPQPEAGQSATSILDDVATSTGGVLYDTRAGHLAMQARNHRYNEASSFTLSAAAQQIEPDLTVVDDHRYTKNVIEFSRSGSDETPSKVTDEASRAAYGDFNPGAYTVVSVSDTEVEAFAQNLLARYADPSPRVSQITVDVMDLPTEDLRAAVLNADIGTRFELASLPLQIPSDPTFVFFEGATETVSMSGHTLQVNTTPADVGQNVFILDDATYGVLDSNVLAY